MTRPTLWTKRVNYGVTPDGKGDIRLTLSGVNKAWCGSEKIVKRNAAWLHIWCGMDNGDWLR